MVHVESLTNVSIFFYANSVWTINLYVGREKMRHSWMCLCFLSCWIQFMFQSYVRFTVSSWLSSMRSHWKVEVAVIVIDNNQWIGDNVIDRGSLLFVDVHHAVAQSNQLFTIRMSARRQWLVVFNQCASNQLVEWLKKYIHLDLQYRIDCVWIYVLQLHRRLRSACTIRTEYSPTPKYRWRSWNRCRSVSLVPYKSANRPLLSAFGHNSP